MSAKSTLDSDSFMNSYPDIVYTLEPINHFDLGLDTILVSYTHCLLHNTNLDFNRHILQLYRPATEYERNDSRFLRKVDS